MKKQFLIKSFVLFSLLALMLSMSAAPVTAAEKININTASVEQLQELKNVGQVKAERIVQYRQEQPFQTIEEIQKVKGIGQKTYAEIKDEITVE